MVGIGEQDGISPVVKIAGIAEAENKVFGFLGRRSPGGELFPYLRRRQNSPGKQVQKIPLKVGAAPIIPFRPVLTTLFRQGSETSPAQYTVDPSVSGTKGARDPSPRG